METMLSATYRPNCGQIVLRQKNTTVKNDVLGRVRRWNEFE